MRHVDHGISPAALSPSRTGDAQREIEDFLQRPEAERSTRRAPFDEKLLRGGDVVMELFRVFHGKCAYCETPDASGLDFHHHRPLENATTRNKTSPSHYAWLAYEWENLLLACGACQRRKQTFFPVRGNRAPVLSSLDLIRANETPDLIDPGFDRPERHLDFTLDGICHPRSQRGAATIALLELNRPDLLDSRRKAFDTLSDQVRSETSTDAFCRMMETAATGALAILRHRYAKAVARLRGLPDFAFDATRGMLAGLHKDADIATLRTAYAELETPAPARGERFRSHTPWQGWSPPIRRIEIENFKAIEHLVFELPPNRPDSKDVACLMLLGENATAKSTVLEAVTLALAGGDAANHLGLKPKDYLRRTRLDMEAGEMVPARVRIEFYEGPPAELIVPPSGEAFEGTKQASANVLAYGSRRFFLKGRRKRQRSGGIRTLFDPMWVIPHPDLWLRTLNPDQFRQVAQALRDILGLGDNDEIRRDDDHGVVILSGGREISVERHSDGYRSLFATAVDMVRGMLGQATVLTEARGVVMIDEIETHLHPRWKMRVMTALRKALPQVQFLVTTHDPLCLRGMSNGEVKVMIRSCGDHIEQRGDLPDVRTLRAEQLLTSDYFGLVSTADPELEMELAQRADQLQSGQATYGVAGKLTGAITLGDTPQEQLAAQAMDAFLKTRSEGDSAELKAAREDAVKALKAMLEPGVPELGE
ncbi:MAG: AAA family ATPase [Asticcacaulis sp.]|nr:AAA family ATPase [Asticcacaulis sp.]